MITQVGVFVWLIWVIRTGGFSSREWFRVLEFRDLGARAWGLKVPGFCCNMLCRRDSGHYLISDPQHVSPMSVVKNHPTTGCGSSRACWALVGNKGIESLYDPLQYIPESPSNPQKV